MKKAQTKIFIGDCRDVLKSLPANSVHCCVTSPPYFGLRDYGHKKQIGLESTMQGYVAEMVNVFREVKRVLRDEGTLWLNLGDSYAGGGGMNGGTSKAFGGSGTTGMVANDLGRDAILIELNPKNVNDISKRRLDQKSGFFVSKPIIEEHM